MATKTLTTSYLAQLTNANHDGVTQQIDDRFAEFETDNAMFIAARQTVHQARQGEDTAFKRFSGKDFASDGFEAEARKVLNMSQQWAAAQDYTLQELGIQEWVQKAVVQAQAVIDNIMTRTSIRQKRNCRSQNKTLYAFNIFFPVFQVRLSMLSSFSNPQLLFSRLGIIETAHHYCRHKGVSSTMYKQHRIGRLTDLIDSRSLSKTPPIA